MENKSTTQNTRSNTGPRRSFWRRHLILCNIFLIMVCSILLVVFANFFLSLWTRHGDNTVVPNIRNLSYEEAIEVLDDADLKYVISDSVYDLTKRPGQVVDVFPKPGAVVKSGREVYLTIVSFAPQQLVLDVPLDGQSVKGAEAYLKALGIKNIHIVRVPSPYPDLVLSVKYNGRRLSVGSRVPVNARITLEVGMAETPVISNDTSLDNEITNAISNSSETPESDEPVTQPDIDPVYD